MKDVVFNINKAEDNPDPAGKPLQYIKSSLRLVSVINIIFSPKRTLFKLQIVKI